MRVAQSVETMEGKMDEQNRRIAAVLAGLRLLQSNAEGRITIGDHEHAAAIDDIATSGGEFDVLDPEAIDALCEAINTGQITLVGDIA